jgi:N-acetylneuraminic acid mutarotase
MKILRLSLLVFTAIGLAVPSAFAADPAIPAAKSVKHGIEPLTPAVTSIGAAIAGGRLYVYGGNMAGAHSYSKEEQGRNLYSVSLQGGAWTKGEDGPPLQGLALVEHKGKLYRIGGFTAQNAKGEKHRLESQVGVAMYDPATKKWTDLPPLPEPRSSADAAVIGDTIYVVGGWDLAGSRGTENPGSETWHKTAWKLDLSQSDLKWQPIPDPPFQRRALALAAYNGKLYAIGGMQQVGGITSRTAIFDPATGQWTEGPAILGEGRMTGFGSSAFAAGGRLYVTTINGDLQRLSEDGKRWEIVAKMPTARFFHRMLPIDDKHLLVVGGANMSEGKFEEVEIIEIP